MFPVRVAVLLCFLSNAHAQDKFNTQCGPSERVTFIKLPHDGQALLGNAEIVVPNQALKDCVDMCRMNVEAGGERYPCAGVDYVRDTRTCMISGPIEEGAMFVLKNDVGDTLNSPPLVLPFDEDHLAELFANSDSAEEQFANLKESSSGSTGASTVAANNSALLLGTTDTTGFYKKICLKAMPASHISHEAVYAFEQTPNRVLLESTDESVHANSSEECIAYCLEAKELYDFVCLSVMYYYETQDCLLNSEDQHTSGRSLIRDTEGLRVDYFENHVVTSECGAGTTPQYVAVNGTGAADVTADHIIEKTSKDACEHFCSINRAESKPFLCKAFTYKKSTQQCLLLSDTSTISIVPTGKAEKDEIFMEKVCLGAASTCIQSPVFEKIADVALIGFSQVILANVRTAEICLTECMRSLTKFDFACLSAMFYVETLECVLNYDTWRTPGNEIYLASDELDVKVDYYDNLCAIRAFQQGSKHSNQCPPEKESTYVMYAQETVANQFDNDAFQAESLDDCFKGCEMAQNFTCNSANYREMDGLCVLSSQNSKTVPLVTVSDTTNHFDRRCIRGSRFSCGETGVSFEAHAGRQLDRNVSLEVSGVSDDECLSLCLQDPSKSCRSANYIEFNSTCQLNEQVAHDGELKDEKTATYFVNKCFDTPSTANAAVIHQQLTGENTYSETAPTDLQLFTDCQYGAMKVLLNAPVAFTGFLFAKNRFGSCRADVTGTTSAELALNFPDYSQARQDSYGHLPDQQGDCGVIETWPKVYSAIVIVQMNALGIPGLVTEGDRFFNITCDYSNPENNKVTAQGVAVNVKNSPKTMVDLHPDGRIDIPSPMLLSLRRESGVVVRTATLGERLNLVFEYNQAFNRNTMGLFVRQCNATRGYGGLLPQPDPLVMIDDGCPMPAVQDTIITGPVAETQNGFVVPFSAFKFDGGNTIKIICMIDMCEGGCNPTTCSIGTSALPSYGRRKRNVVVDNTTLIADTTSPSTILLSSPSSLTTSAWKSTTVPSSSTIEPTTSLTSLRPSTTTSPQGTTEPSHVRNVTKSEMRSLVFTVLDHAPAVEEEERIFEETKMHKEDFNEQQKDKQAYTEEFVTKFMSSKDKQVCLRKATFLGVVLLLTSICMCEAIVIVVYCVRRWISLRLDAAQTQKLS